MIINYLLLYDYFTFDLKIKKQITLVFNDPNFQKNQNKI